MLRHLNKDGQTLGVWSLILVELVENLFLRSAELLVFLPVKAVFSQKFVEGTVVEMITEAV